MLFRRIHMLFLAGLPTLLQAQDTINRIDPIGVQVTYEPNLRDARKIDLTPETEKRRFEVPRLEYSIYPVQWDARRVVKVQPPSKIKINGDSSGTPNYAKAGYGLYNFKHLGVYLANRPNPKYSYGVKLHHLSADQNNSSRDFSDNSILLSGSRFFNRSSFTGVVSYDRNMVRFYGMDTSFRAEGVETRKITDAWKFSTRYENKELGKKPGFYAGFSFQQFGTNLNQSESELNAEAGAHKNLKTGRIAADFGLGTLNVKQDTNNQNILFFDVRPSYRFHKKKTEVSAGFNATYLVQGKIADFYINPVVHAEYQLMPDAVRVFGGISGGVQRNSLSRMNQTNPFLYDSIALRQTYESFSIYGGAKGKITNNSEFRVTLSHRNLIDMPLYINSGDSLNSFMPVYDNIGITRLNPEVRFGVGEKFKLSLSGMLNAYNLESEARAWQLPNTEFKVDATYQIGNKIRISAYVHGMGTRYQQIYLKQNNLKVKGFMDANLMTEYHLSERFRVWLNLANMTSNSYQYWYRYPRYGFTALGGLAVSF
ncbi:MAG: hypothetical protein KJS92_01225 [Bacteroidetes bacterium]|nr:hypothetical protein [Bacteroidota bacterium]